MYANFGELCLVEVRRITLPRTPVNRFHPLQAPRAYAAEGCSTRGLMRAATTSIPAKTQNVTTRPAAPATAPAVSAPKTCPTAMSREAAPSPADGRSWNTETDQTRMIPVSMM
jgi:hypothetical protein